MRPVVVTSEYKPSVTEAAPRSILFIIVSRIGDSLFATPAIRAVARAYPQAKITVLGHPKRAEVFQNLPGVTRVGSITKGRALLKGRLGGKPYDLAFVTGFDRPLVAYAQRVSRRVVAFAQGDPALDAKLTPAVPLPPFQSEHAVLQLLRLPEAVGVASAGLRLGFSLTAEEVLEARQRLAAVSLSQHRPLIGLQVASFPTKAYRDWPIEHFRDLCDRISARWPEGRFLIFGGPEEKERTHWLAAALGSRAALFAGHLTLRQTAGLMSQIDLYVGIDTGPTHIMSAFDKPMVAMYHCLSSSHLTGPLEHPCAYLLNHPALGTDRCCETSHMGEISVDQVFVLVEKALAPQFPEQGAR